MKDLKLNRSEHNPSYIMQSHEKDYTISRDGLLIGTVRGFESKQVENPYIALEKSGVVEVGDILIDKHLGEYKIIRITEGEPAEIKEIPAEAFAYYEITLEPFKEQYQKDVERRKQTGYHTSEESQETKEAFEELIKASDNSKEIEILRQLEHIVLKILDNKVEPERGMLVEYKDFIDKHPKVKNIISSELITFLTTLS